MGDSFPMRFSGRVLRDAFETTGPPTVRDLTSRASSARTTRRGRSSPPDAAAEASIVPSLAFPRGRQLHCSGAPSPTILATCIFFFPFSFFFFILFLHFEFLDCFCDSNECRYVRY